VKDALQVVVSDDAIAFNPFELEAPDLAAPVETRELGGLGIHLVKNIMDECSYRRFEEHNIVTLTKKFDPQR
jgi:anti-sigma regulatory factor (Ser/Thr protein kinase)